jgi:hypothetical protein
MKNILLPLILVILLISDVQGQWSTNSGGTTYYTSTTNGYKVGIGVNPATEKLHVAGNILSNGTITGTTITSTGIFQSSSTNNLSLRTNGTIRLTILNSNGNVGLGSGITNPLERLHLDGSIRGNQSGAVRISSGFGTMDIGAKGTSYGNLDTDRASFLFNKRIIVDEGIISSFDESLQLQASGATAITILSGTGNVGIGTSLSTNPNSYKLAVNGKIGAKEVQVETTSATWPDYVFQPEYKLLSIAEVEFFINKNKHLPDVPSADEIEKDGHLLGEMDAVLLKKIEEITLYIIELKKENETLKGRIEELERKN